jgi:hypothetical protein
MNEHPIAPDLEITAEQRAAFAQFYLRTLHTLIDIGVAQARDVQQGALPRTGAAVLGRDDMGAPLAAAPDPALQYERVSRSIRRSIMMARDIAEPVSARDAGAVGQSRARARKRIIRAVEDTIERVTGEDGGAERGESLRAEMFERLDSPEMDDDLDNRPIDEIIDEIRHDLGLTGLRDSHQWKRLTPADLAELSVRAAAPLGAARTAPARESGERAGWGRASAGGVEGAVSRGSPRIAVRDG